LKLLLKIKKVSFSGQNYPGTFNVLIKSKIKVMSNEINTNSMMSNNALMLDQIKQIAPSVFTTEKAAHLTDKYIQTPTSRVVEDLMALGWNVTKAQEVKSKKFKGFQKHIVVFRHPDITIKSKEGDDAFPQILLTNSHDGKAAFNFRVGIFRLICSNGLVISDADFNNVSIRHTNYTFESLQAKISEVIAKLPGLVQKINLFKSTKLTEEQMVDFAYKAVSLRSKATVNIMDVLEATRNEDKGNDLWVVFNRVQEKVIGGSYSYGNKNRKARSVKSFQKDIELNEELFELAETYLAA
jgi:hypothetical protein